MSAAPPFRAEHIGSLLRPASLLELRARAARAELPPGELAAAEDRAIEDALRLQERIGFRFATDGEFRRRSYHSYFFSRLGDITIDALAPASAAATGKGAQPRAVIRSRIQWSGPIHVADYEFLGKRTSLLPKITIPGPCALHFRGGNAAVTAHAYRDVDQFWSDTVQAFRAELEALAAAGCSYVQIDETAFAKFDDPDVRAALAARGEDWGAVIDTYIDVTNRVLRGLPPGLSVGMHLCRGNRGGHWHAEGSYEPVAERLFNQVAVGFFLLEFDTPRAGSFAPLRFLPKDKSAVLGMVSTKTMRLEEPAELMRRLDEASRYVDIDRLAVSPQCGFASVDSGNPVTPQVQEAKLRRVVELAESVWKTT